MIKYMMTSSKFSGKIIFGFDNDFLAFYHDNSELNEAQKRWLFTNFPFTLEGLKAISKVIQGKLELVPIDLSFDAFWDEYAKKVNRIRCEPLWKKLSDAEKMTCIISIKHYDNYLKRMGNRAKLDPENYLKKESFQNNWASLKS